MKKKRVLVVYYSQTGQLESVLRSMLSPLEKDPQIELTYRRLEPVEDYPFPWGFFPFLDSFPESVYMDGPPLKDTGLQGDEDFDLLLLGNTIWYLSPAPPISSFLFSPEGKKLIQKTPVVSVIACRNMWLQGFQKLSRAVQQIGGKIIDNVVLVDQGSSLATFITTPRWMLTGKKNAMGGLLPPAGVADRDIKSSVRFGFALKEALENDREKTGEPLLEGLGAVHVDVRLIPSEKAAHRSFLVWGKIVRSFGKPGNWKRKPILFLYVLFLITLIITVVPLTMFIRILLSPLLKKKLEKQKKLLEEPSGSSTHRLRSKE